ncbi:hypothetical protein H0H93_012703 [Arthromyces matolae]|nr:hypothetical protein H0H93_012703 [Arthromyces matolae]
MFPLPTEIYSLIFGFAVHSDDALDTTFGNYHAEHRDDVLKHVQEDLALKLALTLVSKSFRAMMDPLLYEVILIFRFDHIPILLERLRSVTPGCSKPSGHMCRRLDIYLGTWGNAGYHDEAWYVGGHTLWGLLPACPRLEVLVARVNHRNTKQPYMGAPHLTHNALWKTISSCCAATLRRLELFGFSIRMDRLEMMLRYMSSLQICDISHLTPFAFLDLTLSSDSRKKILLRDGPDEYDDEEPTSRVVIVDKPQTTDSSFPRSIPITVVQSERGKRSKKFSKIVLTEFQDAKQNAAWPAFNGHGPPYVLPNLHTLNLNSLDERFFEFVLPALKSLTVSDVKHHDVIFDLDPIATHFQYGSMEPVDSPPFSDLSEGTICDGYIVLFYNSEKYKRKVKYYPKPAANVTLFGQFPNSLTHVQMPHHYLPLVRALYFFPSIVSLTWDGAADPHRGDLHQYPATATNMTLQAVTLDCTKSEVNRKAKSMVGEVRHAVVNGRLLRLKEMIILSTSKDYIPYTLNGNEFAGLDVHWTTKVVKESQLVRRNLYSRVLPHGEWGCGLAPYSYDFKGV